MLILTSIKGLGFLINAVLKFQMDLFQEKLCSLNVENSGSKAFISQDELSGVLYEIDHKRVSISCGKFKLTFSLLANVCIPCVQNE